MFHNDFDCHVCRPTVRIFHVTLGYRLVQTLVKIIRPSIQVCIGASFQTRLWQMETKRLPRMWNPAKTESPWWQQLMQAETVACHWYSYTKVPSRSALRMSPFPLCHAIITASEAHGWKAKYSNSMTGSISTLCATGHRICTEEVSATESPVTPG